MTDVRGRLLHDRYEIVAELGAGGEARVVKALDRRHDRMVALKIRAARGGATDIGGDTAARDALLREARALLALPPHPALPLARDDFFDGGEYVVVMDWVEGTDLARILSDEGTPGLAPTTVLAHLAQAAAALTVLHAQDPPVLHGDFKPANLVLARGGAVKLVDFGLSSNPGAIGRRAGTPGYRAPELAAGAAPTRATDVYALAATAFALFTGAPPAGVLPDWPGLAPARAAELEDALRAGLATDPARRPATPGELVERLRAGWTAALPTGVLTFLLTDVVDSTARWERGPAAMAQALVRHDAMLAAAVESRGGHVVRSMGEDDATLSVFTSAPQALAAGHAAAEAIGDALPVRMALHTGEADRREGDHAGPAVNLAARLRGQAAAGEILVSQATADVAGAHLPDGTTLVDLGPHHLDGVAAPVGVHTLTTPGGERPHPVVSCPYRGLLAFGPAEQDWFFGREDVVAQIIPRLGAGRLTALVGASGTGKSSVLAAGVVAAARTGAIPGVEDAVLTTPGASDALETVRAAGPATLLVVDQLEELFTLVPDPAARRAFADALLAHPGPALAGVRADFYGALAEHAALARAVAADQVLLEPMTADALRRAIAEPARRAGLRLEPGLEDVVLADVDGEPGALPLVSHALRATWERRDGRTLTLAGYRASGGVSSALAQSADAVVAGTPERDRPRLRGLFVRLTALGDGVQDTRRRVPIADLAPEGTDPAHMRALLDRLADARLITLGDGSAELAHEVLIRRWPALRAWLDEDREGLRLHRRLGDAARLWGAGGRERGDLYRGARLGAAGDWAATHHGDLNPGERAFLDASTTAAGEERDAERRAARRLRRALAAAAALLLAAVALAVVALLAQDRTARERTLAQSRALAAQSGNALSSDPVLGLLLAREAVQRSATPEALFALRAALDASTLRRELPAQACPQLGEPGAPHAAFLPGGRLLAEVACRHLDIVDATRGRTVRRLPVRPADPAGANAQPLAVDPRRGSIAVATAGGVRLLDARGRTLGTVGTGAIDAVAFSDDGRFLAFHRGGGARDALLVRDTVRGTTAAVAGAPRAPYTRIIFTPGADRLVLVTATPRVEVRERASGRLVRDLGPGTIAALSPDGTRLAVATQPTTDGVLTVRSGPDFARARTLSRFELVDASALAFSPDGSTLGVGLHDGSAGVRSLATGREIVAFRGGHSRVSSLAFGPGGRGLVTTAEDGAARLWAATAGEKTRIPTTGGEPFNLVLARGRITAAFFAGLVGRYHARSGLPDGVFRAFRGNSYRNGQFYPSLSPDGALVAYQERVGGPLLVRRVSGDRAVLRVLPHRTGGTAAFAPAGSARVAVFGAGGARLWPLGRDATRRKPIAFAGSARGDSCGGFLYPSFTADAHLVVASTFCGAVGVWDGRTGRLVRSFTSPDVIFSAPVFSPDARYVAWGSTDATASVWSLAARRRVQVLHGHSATVTSVAFSPDGRRIATAGLDATVRIWDRAAGRELRVLSGPDYAPQFSADGRDILTSDHPGTLALWAACPDCGDARALLALARGRITRGFTAQERRAYLDDL